MMLGNPPEAEVVDISGQVPSYHPTDELTIVRVKHNMEMAHRLSLTPGKCEQIHGHSWWATLSIGGFLDDSGKVVEFGQMKKAFRNHLDSRYDHKLLLNKNDTLVRAALQQPAEREFAYPGLQAMDFDPTTENIAHAIFKWARGYFGPDFVYQVTLQETSVNFASVGDLRL